MMQLRSSALLVEVMKTIILCLAALAALHYAPSIAQARTSSAEAGRRIAEKFCARCHAIGPTGESTHRDAPPFRDIAAKGNVENLEEALAEGIVVGHPDMPQFQFEAPDVAALVAYLKSLGGKG
ncbi:MAG TPA: cytochrome c [Hyphomicrobiales bacterium]|nr:cytochrome c [Hyphomicrobiales bacterium]